MNDFSFFTVVFFGVSVVVFFTGILLYRLSALRLQDVKEERRKLDADKAYHLNRH